MSSSNGVCRLSWTFSLLLGAALMASGWSQARSALPPPHSDRSPAWLDYRAGERMDFIIGRLEAHSQPEDVCALLVESIVQVESSGNAQRVGRNGERGLMQIKSATWAETTGKLYGDQVPFTRAFEPELNRQVGLAYLRRLRAFLHEHRASWRSDERSLLLACYNAGPERVRQAGFRVEELPATTRDYVQRASALHESLLSELTLQAAVPPPGENV